jgi:phosphopantetheine adenylyltransferase
MKEMVHFSKRKDANLLVASVLLISVMVVVSVAVDSLSGKTVQSTQIEKFAVSNFAFSSGNTISIVVENNGTIPLGIAEVCIDNAKQQFTENATIVQPNDYLNLSINFTYSNDTNYQFKLVTERGTTYLFTAATL